MKKQLITLVAIFIASISFAQNQSSRIVTPGGFNYKALITDNGNVVANQPVDIKFTLTTFYGATVVWVEEHTGLSTDANGIIVTSIGEGTRLSGTETYFNSIDFSRKMRLTVEVNINNTGYQTLNTSTLKYVPQAKYARKAGRVDYNNIDNLPANLDTDDTDDVTKLDDLLDAKATITTTFIGVNAGQNNTASNNVGIGKDALKTNTTSTGNTAVGSGTLKTNTGEYNTAVGIRVLNSNTTGHNNTSVGSFSLYGNTDGYENTAMGHGALNRNTTGFVNVAVGVRSLANNLTGSNNVAIGAYAGYNSTGSNNVFIGKQAGRDETGDNKLYIANSQTATPLIYGDFASSELTINGNFAVKNGSEGVGKIFTSDANGKGTWQDVSAWDTDASDDFSGDYNDLSNKPTLFYVEGTTNTATLSSENISHAGDLFLGDYSFNSIGVNNASLRINRRKYDDNDSYGMVSVVDGSGSGRHYGLYLSLSGNGTGNQFGTYSSIYTSGDAIYYGMFNSLSGSGAGTRYGSVNKLQGSSSGEQIGTANYVYNTGNGSHYAIENVLSGAGTGNQYGIKNNISNTSDGLHYGTYNYLSGTGTGNKYGTFSKISSSAGGRHYALYAEATKDATNVYAGYFVGDVNIKTGNLNVEDKLTAPSSGNADMKAYIYGTLVGSSTDVSIVSDASSTGFTVSRISTGKYEVTFSDTSILTNDFTVVATSYASSNPELITYVKSGHTFIIHAWNLSGTHRDTTLSFIVYKK